MTAAGLNCHGTTGVGGGAARAAQPARYAAGTGERAEVIRDNSRREAPRMSSDLIRRSRDTGGSPASTFAMRACLDGRARCEVCLREISAPPTIAKAGGQLTL